MQSTWLGILTKFLGKEDNSQIRRLAVEHLHGLQTALRINFHKSELFCFGKAREHEEYYTQLFGCDVGRLPFHYLGLPMSSRKLSNKEREEIKNRIEKRLTG